MLEKVTRFDIHKEGDFSLFKRNIESFAKEQPNYRVVLTEDSIYLKKNWISLMDAFTYRRYLSIFLTNFEGDITCQNKIITIKGKVQLSPWYRVIMTFMPILFVLMLFLILISRTDTFVFLGIVPVVIIFNLNIQIVLDRFVYKRIINQAFKNYFVDTNM
ncbi:hypothetical protein ACE1ET_01230 [Saccharicrinis sp. FJH62]|uniref:hypothetical protein n=1 Tax=Saccharicrinis sp. FJH62 TaxID=3344657 RepID=UPI0035D4E4CB